MVKTIKFKDFLTRSKIPIEIEDSHKYKRVTIKIKHGGVSLRDEEIGKKIGTKKQFILKKGQFIVSKIDARYGAFGIAPSTVDEAIITGNFWAFDVDFNIIDINWFNQFTNSQYFYDLCERASTGITHRKYLSEEAFLNNEVNLPSILEQKKAVEYMNILNSTNASIKNQITHQLDLIKDLRQAFLREAMQGLLVSNETSDGKTGADLLAEIQAEKAQLIKEKKIKKPKPLAPITQEEIPFEIPENWTWCRLGKIIEYTHNLDIQKKLSEDTIINYVDIDAIDNKKFIIREAKIKRVSELSSRARRVLKKDYIIYSTVRPYLKNIAIIEHELPNFIGSTGFLVFKTYLVLNKFIFNFLLNPILNNEFEKLMVGFNSPSITNETFENTLFPLPPLEIQERIVAKLNKLMTFCDQLEEQTKQNQQTNDLLLQQVLREALGEKKEEKGELTELQLVAEPTEQYIAKPFTAKTCDKNDMAVLAGYIIQELNTKDFGRVKLQKMLHLVEYHCQLETNFNYYKKVAGPHAEELKESIEPILQRNRFFDIKKEKLGNKEKVNYTALAGASQINKFFNSDFKEQKENIDFVLHKFRNKTWEFCEMISTMFAVWNNRLIKQQSITNDDLKKDFLEWDKEKIKFVDQLDYAIEWIKKENMEPKGLGKYIDKPQTK
ncbi:restriction endonuclease subunit S [Elizabethkingia anophelis]|uniref:restriction endonuclease subunit S n=1 Tax=Elizabethkingia anophelis TaxID=1117645 RepID=UPI00063BDF36|nr:restriction endonuclease subunit S [Elizabethkingia anophelis]AKH93618.1 hypothetical protein M876_03415 [Elizabethkingia anophelis FMS-007]